MRLQDQATGRKDMLRFRPASIRVTEGWNERTEFHGIPELGRSMYENGQIQPILIHKDEDDQPALIDGERRLRGGLWIVENLDPDWEILAVPGNPKATELERLFLQVEGNSGHQFTLLEKARIYKRARDLGASQQDIADHCQTTKQAVSRALMLVEKGAPDLLSLVEQGKISGTVAGKIIDKFPDDHDGQLEEAKLALAAAAGSGKERATSKHLTKAAKIPALTFTFERSIREGDDHDFNEHGICTQPDTCTVTGFPKAWKVDHFILQVARISEGSYGYSHDIWMIGGSSASPSNDSAGALSFEHGAWNAAWNQAVTRIQAYADHHGHPHIAAIINGEELRAQFRAAIDTHLQGHGGAQAGSDDPASPAAEHSSPSAGDRPHFVRLMLTGAPDDPFEDGTMAEDNAFILAHCPPEIGRLHLLTRDTDSGTAFGYRIGDFERRPDIANFETLASPLEEGLHTVLELAFRHLAKKGSVPLTYLDLCDLLDQAIERYYSSDGKAEAPLIREYAATPAATAEPEAERSALPLEWKAFKLLGRPPEPDAAGSYQEEIRFVLTGIPTQSPLELFHILAAWTDERTPRLCYGWRFKKQGEAMVEFLPTVKSPYVESPPQRDALMAAPLVIAVAMEETGLAVDLQSLAIAAWQRFLDRHVPLSGMDEDALETIQWVAKADPAAAEAIKSAKDTNRDGTGVGPGNNGGFVSCDKRLIQADKLLEELEDAKSVNRGRVTTVEILLRFLRNETSPADLKRHLTSND